jgi:hypothetical protein
MKAVLAAIALVLGFAAPAGTDSIPRRDGPPDGLLVLAVLSPERALVADPLSGSTRERELVGGTLCHGPLLALGDHVVFFDLLRSRLVAQAARFNLGPPRFNRLGRARVVGSADVATPSARPGRLWLGTRRRGRIELREVDARGAVHERTSIPVARMATLEADVGGEFLTTSGSDLVLGRERFRDAWLLAVHADRFAFCRGMCRRISVSNGRALEPPPGIRPQAGPRAAFSPDGRRLALPVELAGRPRFAVVDIERNAWRVVPGARPGDYAALAWSPSGDWLYVADRRERLLAVRGGTARPIPLPIRTGGAVMSIATASRAGSAAR